MTAESARNVLQNKIVVSLKRRATADSGQVTTAKGSVSTDSGEAASSETEDGLAPTATLQVSEELDGIFVGLNPLTIAAHAGKRLWWNSLRMNRILSPFQISLNSFSYRFPKMYRVAQHSPTSPFWNIRICPIHGAKQAPARFLSGKRFVLGEELAIHFVQDDLRRGVLLRRKLHRPGRNTDA